MDVPVTELRANLREWVERARGGEDVVITDRGVPVARLVGLDDTASWVQYLTEQGVLSPPESPVRVKASDIKRVKATRSASDLIVEMRDEDR
jgi:prevent-host-death family protein